MHYHKNQIECNILSFRYAAVTCLWKHYTLVKALCEKRSLRARGHDMQKILINSGTQPFKLNELNKYTHKVQNNHFIIDTTQTGGCWVYLFYNWIAVGFFFKLSNYIGTYKFALHCAISIYLLFCADATERAVLCYRGLPAWRSSIKYLQVMEVKECNKYFKTMQFVKY